MNLEVKGLHFTYPGGVTALKNINLSIAEGERVAVVGQNGSGKTTLVRHFNGLLKPTQGSVLIGDWDTRSKSVSSLAARVGYLFQNPDEQLFCKTVEAEVAFGPRNLRFAPEKVAALVADALNLTHLRQQKATNPYDLSPTWRKMVALASVFAMDTPIIVLDEPTTGQDAAGVERIAELVRVASARGKTVISITHDMDFCAENFSRVVALAQGEVLMDGKTQAVMGAEELLARAYVEPPQLTRLGKRLGFQKTICNQEDFLIAWGS